MVWQTPARLGVAAFGVIFAVGVYVAMGDRPSPAPATPIVRIDSKSTSEVLGGLLRRLSGVDEEFSLFAEKQARYSDGSEKLSGVRIEIKNRNGRDFTITADEAQVGANEQKFNLRGNILLKASDGFELQTGDATYDHADGIVRAPGSVTFARGRMAGAGVGMTYDEKQEILTLASGSRVSMYDEARMATTSFESGSSSLDRAADVLTLEDTVHVMRELQEFDADRGVARLSENEDVVRYVELRGSARVSGGGAVDEMSAREIDLDYTDDGLLLERVLMVGEAAAALKGAAGAPARQMFGGRLDLTLAADGTVTTVIGQEGVRLVLPPGDDTPSRTITARTLDATGEAGKGLTGIRFDDTVVYREGASAVATREAGSQSLRLALAAEAVSEAIFTGRATFRDGTLQANATEARYSPARGTLALIGGSPAVSDEQVVINGDTIDVAFETRTMTAAGRARTTYKGTPQKARTGKAPNSKMPGLLKADTPVTVNADRLEYTGSTGLADYRGTVELRQGSGTNIRAGRLTLDQETGNLTATGSARVALVNDKGDVSTGNANEIRYTDATRVIAYTTAAPGTSQLVGAQGDLRAPRITITLAKEAAEVARIDAEPSLTIQVDRRTVTGARLEYIAHDPATKDGKYVVYGTPAHPMTLDDRSTPIGGRSCGMKLTMSKAGGNNVIEGGGLTRPTAGGAGSCAPAPLPPPSAPRAPAPSR